MINYPFAHGWNRDGLRRQAKELQCCHHRHHSRSFAHSLVVVAIDGIDRVSDYWQHQARHALIIIFIKSFIHIQELSWCGDAV